ncbi:putative Golgi SNAP receptor complex member 2 [Clonorchis sinensis]|uniref:Golgi SNAP receptor complex member 2 n=1 Tax=Clonorchis sinensis TaxID=79923 RepID=A0A8T1MWA9_CLOSI|nr:putative Golgi SNAP receptor complex member 2 [Clonorchis sinensis]
MDYDELSRNTKALLHNLPNSFSEVEHRLVGVLSNDHLSETAKLIKDISATLNLISSNCDRLSNLLHTVDPISRRSQARLSLDQMRYECKQYQANLQAAERKRAMKERQLREREDLLAYDFTTNSALRNSNGSTVVKLDADMEHHSRLSAVGRRLDDMLASGSASLAALKEQGMTLKTAKRRLLDLFNTLGLSNTVMRIIERRTHQDKVLFWVLAVATLFLMWVIWRTLH